MCGILGFLGFNGQRVDLNVFSSLTNLMTHRGPDDEGYIFVETSSGDFEIAGGEDTPGAVYTSNLRYTPELPLKSASDQSYNLALSSRRLAIFDLSPAGHQPMCNANGTVWVVHNGEIYNFRELRDELHSLGHSFSSQSDTEVILHAYEEWGTECLSRFNGMWAFCIWDSNLGQLFCARDRFGIKPFYYYLDSNFFAFASEIKPLLHLGVAREPNDELVYDFLRRGILENTNETFFKNINKIPPAHYFLVDLHGGLTIKRYWQLDVSNEIESIHDDDSYSDQFLDLFTDAVRLRLHCDVPVGSCLSGGLDSSSIVCVANRLMFPDGHSLSSETQKTFSACFEMRNIDERRFIKEVIGRTNAESNYSFPTGEGFLQDLDDLLWHQEEPFSGTGVYAQWVVMRQARERGITVMLDGQGGDEQLAGYRKFYVFYLMELIRKKHYPRALLEFVRFFSSVEVMKTTSFRQGLKYFKFGQKLLSIDDLLNDDTKSRMAERNLDFGYAGDLAQRIQADLFQYSLPALLRYEDKNSMAHSVETRLPFLDYRLVELIGSFPFTQKMRAGWTKYVLRQAMRGVLPEMIRHRKSKQGFTTPQDIWFRDPAMSDAVSSAFKKSAFIDRYAQRHNLAKSFQRFSHGSSLRGSEVFFRFFILELWGRKFIQEPRYELSRLVS